MPDPQAELTAQKEKTTGERLLLLFHPFISSLLSAAAFFATYLFVLRPGYDVNDDIDNVGLVSGYFTGAKEPYVPNSNAPWGNILSQLYTFQDKINWEVLIFVAINFLSVWILLYILFSRTSKTGHRLLGIVAVLVCDSYFLLNLTFTTISGFAALAAICAILMAGLTHTHTQKVLLVTGILLVLVASLVRIQPVLLVLLIVLPAVLISYRSFDTRKVIIATCVTGLLILGGWVGNSFYVGQSPAWNAFYEYNVARQNLKDTPRLANIDNQYQAVGWSKNDLREFEGWFFPDKDLYSLEKLQYLVQHIPNRQPSKVRTALSLAGLLVSPPALPYLLVTIATWLGMLLYGWTRRAILPLSVLTVSFLAVDFYVAWTMKIPNRVLLPSLSVLAIFGLCILDWSQPGGAGLFLPPPRNKLRSRLSLGAIAVLLGSAVALVASQAVETTRINIQKQAAYQHILADLDALQEHGKIAQNALILAPAYGIPMEWSNPLAMDFPRIRYLDMGWLTLSPAYYKLLREFDVQSLPAGFYQKDNVYLMTRADSVDGILQFIKEHEGQVVTATSLYVLPEHPFSAEYSSVQLYRLHAVGPTTGN